MRLSLTQLIFLCVLFLLLFYKDTLLLSKLNMIVSYFIRFLKKFNSTKKVN